MPDTTFIASESASSGMGAYTVTVNTPTGTLEGHMMIACVGAAAFGGAVDTVPSGWTGVTQYHGCKMYYKVADAGDEALTNYTWDLTTIATGFASAPVLGIISTYADWPGTDGLASGIGALFGGGSTGIPGYSNQSVIFQTFQEVSLSPPLVTQFRYPHIIVSLDEQRSSLTPPTDDCGHAELREAVSESGFLAGFGANAAWTMTMFDLLVPGALHQPEYMPSVVIGSNSSTSSGNTSLGAMRNYDTGTEGPFDPVPPAPNPIRALEVPETKLNLTVLPNKLTVATLDGLE